MPVLRLLKKKLIMPTQLRLVRIMIATSSKSDQFSKDELYIRFHSEQVCGVLFEFVNTSWHCCKGTIKIINLPSCLKESNSRGYEKRDNKNPIFM